MILSFFILGGFQQTIKDKIYNVKGHLEITEFSLGNSFDESPISNKSEFLSHLNDFEYVTHIQSFAHKAGMLRTTDEVHGVQLKGISADFDTLKISENMRSGRFIHLPDSGYTNEVVISARIASKLRLKLNDDVTIFFVQEPPRFRKLTIVGIYETGLEEFDERLVYGDLGLIRRLNDWDDTMVGGFEVFIDKSKDSQAAREDLYSRIDSDLYVTNVDDKYVQIFDWLGLLNQNVTIFLSLILIVACFNMISILLILIMERTFMVGVLQSLGSTQRQIKQIFLYNGVALIVKGLVLGNVLALVIAFVQDYFKIIPLDPANYYMYYVPIAWDLESLVFLNVLTFLVVSISLFIPLHIITRIKPAAALRFD